MTENKDISALNTFGLKARSKYYCEITNPSELATIITQAPEIPVLVLGGGSNILFTKDYEGLIIHNSIKGKELVKEDNDHVVLKIGGGENWHELVLYTIEKGWGGIENLSLIPGSVGAAPIQNIGAYGVEIKDVSAGVDFVRMEDFTSQHIEAEECQFGYRDSIFKRELKGKGIVSYVYLKLSKKPKLNLNYGAIKNTLEKNKIQDPTIKDVSDAVIQIRQSKLPDPAVIGNSGSFFKNPVVTQQKYEELQATFEEIPGYPNEDQVKIPAGWLIEKSGWKGYRKGDAGVHQFQALVLVNHGNATGKEIHELSLDIRKSIFENFGIVLETEVNIL